MPQPSGKTTGNEIGCTVAKAEDGAGARAGAGARFGEEKMQIGKGRENASTFVF